MVHDGSINIRNWYATILFYSLWQLVKWFLMYVTYRNKCSIAKIIREENTICNQFKHLEKEHSTLS